jgi:hypothetical protein
MALLVVALVVVLHKMIQEMKKTEKLKDNNLQK